MGEAVDGGCILARHREMGPAFPWGAKRKRRPSLKPQNGTPFPDGIVYGNGAPF